MKQSSFLLRITVLYLEGVHVLATVWKLVRIMPIERYAVVVSKQYITVDERRVDNNNNDDDDNDEIDG